MRRIRRGSERARGGDPSVKRDVLNNRVLSSPVSVPPWMTQLADRYRARFVPEATAPPMIVLTPAPSPDRFCGRHFPRENVVALCLSGAPVVTRAVLVHELTHWARKYQGDPRGRHDAAFLRLARDAYRFFRVPRHLALEIDHDLPA